MGNNFSLNVVSGDFCYLSSWLIIYLPVPVCRSIRYTAVDFLVYWRVSVEDDGFSHFITHILVFHKFLACFFPPIVRCRSRYYCLSRQRNYSVQTLNWKWGTMVFCFIWSGQCEICTLTHYCFHLVWIYCIGLASCSGIYAYLLSGSFLRWMVVSLYWIWCKNILLLHTLTQVGDLVALICTFFRVATIIFRLFIFFPKLLFICCKFESLIFLAGI